jgi:glycosyltransferase involved in cell wall biosynthesis
MHILFVLPYAPSVVRVRSYEFVRALLRRGHRVTLTAPVEREGDVRALQEMRTAGAVVVSCPLGRVRKAWNLLRALPTAAPLQAVFSWHPALAQRARDVLHRDGVDAVHVEHLRGARYVHALSADLPSGVPLVWDAVDSITHLFEQTLARSPDPLRRWIALFELNRTRSCEARTLQVCTHAIVTSAVDRAALLQLANANFRIPSNRAISTPFRGGDGVIRKFHRPQTPDAPANDARVSVISNGVDLQRFRPAFDQPSESQTIVFSGRMSYHANAAAALRLARDIFPRVRARRPHAKLQIVGRDPGPEVCALERENSGVTIVGAVDDLAPCLRRATVSAAPLVYGSGVQNKILEALACGTPVVADPLAVRALDASVYDALLIADDDDAFAAHVVRIFDDAALRRRLAHAGRAFVEQHHSWDVAAARLEQVYRL